MLYVIVKKCTIFWFDFISIGNPSVFNFDFFLLLLIPILYFSLILTLQILRINTQSFLHKAMALIDIATFKRLQISSTVNYAIKSNVH